MIYVETLIRVAPDSPTQTAIIPTAKDAKKTVAVLEYELLIAEPYTYTQDKAQFAVHAQHKNISEAELEENSTPHLWPNLGPAFVPRRCPKSMVGACITMLRAGSRCMPLKAPNMYD